MQRIYVICRNGTLEEDGYLTDDLLDCVAFIQKQYTPSEAETQEIAIVECEYSDDGAFIRPLGIRYLNDFWSHWQRKRQKRRRKK